MHHQQIGIMDHDQQHQRPSDRYCKQHISQTAGDVGHAQLANPGAGARRDEEVEPQEGAQQQHLDAGHKHSDAHGGEVDEVGPHGRHGEAEDGDGKEAFEELEVRVVGGDEEIEALRREVGADDLEEEDGKDGDLVI